MSSVRELVAHLGYPSYFLVLLGTWKVLGAAALLVPRRALLKEWAYAGAFFTYTGAIVSHLVAGSDRAEVGLLAVFTALTALSWALRPPSRRTSRPVLHHPRAVESKPAPPWLRRDARDQDYEAVPAAPGHAMRIRPSCAGQ